MEISHKPRNRKTTVTYNLMGKFYLEEQLEPNNEKVLLGQHQSFENTHESTYYK
jgi:hypothetical protein